MKRQPDYSYYREHFSALMDYAGSASAYLIDVLRSFDPDTLETHVNGIHAIEEAADNAKHDVVAHIVTSAVSPIARANLMELTQRIDDVTDALEDVVRLLYMYNISSLREDTKDFAKLIHKSCVMTCSVMNEFGMAREGGHLRDYIIAANALREDSDRMHRILIRKLCIEKQHDPLEILKWTKLYDGFAACCDACEHVCDAVENFLLK